MSPSFLIRLLIVGVAGFSALRLTAAPAASVADTFASSGAGPQRLDGRKTPAGGAVWQASARVVTQAAGGHGFATVLDPGTFVARVPVPAGARVLTLEADVRAVPAVEKASWVAIGLGNPPAVPVNILWPEGVFVRGEYECHYTPGGSAGKPHRIKGGRVPQFDADKPVTFLLRLNRETSTLDLEVNHSPVVKGYELANFSFKVVPAFAGFSGYAQKLGVDLISRFSLQASP